MTRWTRRKRSPQRIEAKGSEVWRIEERRLVLSYSRNERDHPCDDRTTDAAAHSRAEGNVAVGEVESQDAGRDVMDHVRLRPRSLDEDASGRYRCLDCRASDGAGDWSGEKQIS